MRTLHKIPVRSLGSKNGDQVTSEEYSKKALKHTLGSSYQENVTSIKGYTYHPSRLVIDYSQLSPGVYLETETELSKAKSMKEAFRMIRESLEEEKVTNITFFIRKKSGHALLSTSKIVVVHGDD